MYGRLAYASEIPSQFSRDITEFIAKRGDIERCDSNDDEGHQYLKNTDKPDPGERAWRGFVPGVDWEAQHLHNDIHERLRE